MQQITEQQLSALQPIIAKRSELKAMRKIMEEGVDLEVTVRTKRENCDHDLQFRLGVIDNASVQMIRTAVKAQLDWWIKMADTELLEAGFTISEDGTLSVVTTIAGMTPETEPAEQADTNEA